MLLVGLLRREMSLIKHIHYLKRLRNRRLMLGFLKIMTSDNILRFMEHIVISAIDRVVRSFLHQQYTFEENLYNPEVENCQLEEKLPRVKRNIFEYSKYFR